MTKLFICWNVYFGPLTSVGRRIWSPTLSPIAQSRKTCLAMVSKHPSDHGLSPHFPVKWMWKLHDGWINVSIAMVITRSSLVQLLILLDWLSIYLPPNNSFSFKGSNILRCGFCCSHIQLQIDLLNWLQNVEVFTNCGL